MHECKRLYIEGDVRYSTLRAHKTSGAPSLSANTPHAEERRAPLILLVTRSALAADLGRACAEGSPHVAPVAPAAIKALAPEAHHLPKVVGQRVAARAGAVGLLARRGALAADLCLARAERVPHVASGASVAPVAAALVALAPPKWRHVWALR